MTRKNFIDNPEYSEILFTIINECLNNPKEAIVEHYELKQKLGIKSNLLNHKIRYFKEYGIIQSSLINKGYREGKTVEYWINYNGILNSILSSMIYYLDKDTKNIKKELIYYNKILRGLLLTYLLSIKDNQNKPSLKEIFHNFAFGIGMAHYRQKTIDMNKIKQHGIDGFFKELRSRMPNKLSKEDWYAVTTFAALCYYYFQKKVSNNYNYYARKIYQKEFLPSLL